MEATWKAKSHNVGFVKSVLQKSYMVDIYNSRFSAAIQLKNSHVTLWKFCHKVQLQTAHLSVKYTGTHFSLDLMVLYKESVLVLLYSTHQYFSNWLSESEYTSIQRFLSTPTAFTYSFLPVSSVLTFHHFYNSKFWSLTIYLCSRTFWNSLYIWMSNLAFCLLMSFRKWN